MRPDLKAMGRRRRIDDILKQQAEERVILPLPLERSVLIKRVKQGDWSGDYLADAFLSCYGMRPFNDSLHRLINLDAEGFRLFHEILHMRHIPGWNDNELYSIACEIQQIQEEQCATKN